MTYHPDPIPSNTLFSSWVFYWAVIYFITRKLLPYISFEYWDPTFAILFALSYQLYALINILFRVNPISRLPRILVKFTILTALFKIIPLYVVLQYNIVWVNSIFSFLCLFLVYCVYLMQNGLEIIDIYNDLTYSYIDDDNRIETYKLMQKIIDT